MPNWTSELAASLVVQLTYAESVMRGFGSIARFVTLSVPLGMLPVAPVVPTAPPTPVLGPVPAVVELCPPPALVTEVPLVAVVAGPLVPVDTVMPAETPSVPVMVALTLPLVFPLASDV